MENIIKKFVDRLDILLINVITLFNINDNAHNKTATNGNIFVSTLQWHDKMRLLEHATC